MTCTRSCRNVECQARWPIDWRHTRPVSTLVAEEDRRQSLERQLCEGQDLLLAAITFMLKLQQSTADKIQGTEWVECNTASVLGCSSHHYPARRRW